MQFLTNINKENINNYLEFECKGNIIDDSLRFDNFYLNKENSSVVEVFYSQLISIFECKCGFKT